MSNITTIDKTLLRGHTLRELHLLLWARSLAGDCVIKDSGGYVHQTTAAPNMGVEVDGPISYRLAGAAGTIATTPHTAVTVGAADLAMPRIDTLYLDGTGLHILPGSPAVIKVGVVADASDWLKWEEPYPASMSDTPGIPLAEIVVGGGVITIVDANIRMLGCPFVPTAANEHSHYSTTNGGVWLTATVYALGIWVEGTGAGDGITYACTVGHTSGASTQPGVGADWETVWRSLAVGSTGATGAAGATIISGAVAPTTEGSNGDYYYDTVTYTFYGPKAAGTWPSGIVLPGDDGSNGAVGAAGSQTIATSGVPLNTVGADGDWAIDTALSIIYGPKAGGVWAAGTSFKGQAGGTMAWYGPYSASINYPVNAGVSFSIGGVISSYICIQATGPLTTVADPTNASYWQITSQGGAGLRVDDETPTGTLNGVNTTFTLAYAPSPAGSLLFTLNGMKLEPGGADFTLTTATLVISSSWAAILVTGCVMRASYLH